MVGSGPGNMRKKQVLFVHSGGPQGLHEGSSDLLAWLKLALGRPYEVFCPPMPDPEQPVYENWKTTLEKQLADLDNGLILIGHSLGGSVILKFLSEEKISKRIDGLFMVGSPFWGRQNWNVNEYILKKNFATFLPEIPGIFIYHSKQDAVVPFKHLSYYATKLPFATIRAIESSEHLFSGGLPEMAYDIKSLSASNN